MTSFFGNSLRIAGAVVVAALVGCAAEPQSEPIAPAPAADEAAAGDEQAEINEALADLPPADRALAEEQGICPVSGEPLGSMGPPIKVSAQGREIFVCCEGCIEEVKNNFDKYAAKLDSGT